MLRNTGLRFVNSYDEAVAIVREISIIPIIATDIFFYSRGEKNVPVLLLAGTEKIHYVFDLRRCSADILSDFFGLKNLKVMSNAYEKILAIYSHKKIRVENITDILLLEQLITNNYFFSSEVKGLDDISEKYLEFKVEQGRRILLDNLIGDISEQMLEYVRIELLVIYRIFLEQVKQIKAASLERISRIESNLIHSLASIQYNGIYFDVNGFMKLFSGVREKSLLGEGSTLDEEEVAKLFKYGVKGNIRLENLLNEFEKNYKDPAHILCQNANELIKCVKLPESRIHSKFIQISSASGRTSSQSPNLFAVPRARIFREYFSSPQGRAIITLDYSTFELGVLAALSKDPHFLKAFKEKLDLHSYVAQLMFSKRVSKTENPELRRRAKAINFGIIYGMTAQGLAKRLGIDKREATRLINTYYMVFPSLHTYIQTTINNAINTGETRTLAGRRCLLDPLGMISERRRKVLSTIKLKLEKTNSELYAALVLKSLEDEYFKKGVTSDEMYIKRLLNVINEGSPLTKILRDIDFKIQELYRFIRNMPVQGSAADIMKLAINKIDEKLFEMNRNAFIVNIVHDEILIESNVEDAAEIAISASNVMRDASRLVLKDIEIDVDVNVGYFWGDNSLNHLLREIQK